MAQTATKAHAVAATMTGIALASSVASANPAASILTVVCVSKLGLTHEACAPVADALSSVLLGALAWFVTYLTPNKTKPAAGGG